MQEIMLEPETEARIKQVKTMNGGTQLFSFEHRAHLGLICREPEVVLIPGLAFAGFNPAALGAIESMKQGDIIETKSDPDDIIYKEWAPPKEYEIEKGFQQTYEIALVIPDALDYPLIVAKKTI